MGGTKKRKGGRKRVKTASQGWRLITPSPPAHIKKRLPAPKAPPDQAVSELVTASSADADRQGNVSCGLARLGVTPTEKPPTICWL